MLFSSLILWIATFNFLCFVLAVESSNASAVASGQFTNPLRPKDGSDPFIVYSDGYYYFMSTTWKDVKLTRAKTLEELKNGETKVVYRGTDPNICCNVWAPGQYRKKIKK
jgi:GH43 family beta-xylosidase